MAIATNDMVGWIRDMLDQRPIVDEDVKTDSAVVGSVSTNFSDENLIDRINRAQWNIVSTCKAQHVPSAILMYTTPLPEINVEIIRLLHSRNFRGASRCVQRSAERHVRLEQAGRVATATYPTYTYEDGELNFYPDNTGAVAWMVVAPAAAITGGNLSVDERFEDAVLYHVVASCYQTLRRQDDADFFSSAYMDEIDPFMTNKRLSTIFDDREVDVE